LFFKHIILFFKFQYFFIYRKSLVNSNETFFTKKQKKSIGITYYGTYTGTSASLVMNIEKIFLDYSDYVFKYIYGMVQNKAEADDLLQDTFIKVIKASNKDIRNWKSYLLTIARNTVYDHWRKRKNKYSLDLFKLKTKKRDIELKLDIEKGIEKLSPKLKEVIVLREINKMEYQEIADILGIEKGTVKSRLSRARDELKDFLEGNR